MSSRITRPQMLMEMAQIVAKRSTCNRLNVGALITRENRVISMGYNGQPPTHPHCQGVCKPGECNTIHAEENAIKYLPPGAGFDLSMYVTNSPCSKCAELITRCKAIYQVFFQSPYRLEDPIDLLLSHGVAVYRVFPNGAIVDQKTDQLVTDALR